MPTYRIYLNDQITSLRLGIAFLFLAVLMLGGCTTLPVPPPSPAVYALPPTSEGDLQAVTRQFASLHSADRSGFLLLNRNEDALTWRLALVDHATTAIDMQYFIWQDDAAGSLLFKRLMLAADRGVRVRMLVDDLGFATRDKIIAAICQHPNFEIKIFNPGRVRESTLGGLGEFLIYFRELNRRMHNKVFVADNQLAIVGGRNIGNEYFGLKAKYNFRDLDVLTVGPAVKEISSAFDRYWNAESAYPGGAMSTKVTREDLQKLMAQVTAQLENEKKDLKSYALEPQSWNRKLRQLPEQLKPGEAHFVQDQPTVENGEEMRLVQMLDRLAAPSHKELIILTPYLIPVGDFLKDLSRLEKEGVAVKILTGSLGSNNHTVTHSHYRKYRRRILETGAELYEFKHDPSAAVMDQAALPRVESKFISLHVKALVGDRRRCFAGSLNLDPRAIDINTENGLYIQSRELCDEMATDFDRLMSADNAWRVRLDEKNRLFWESGQARTSRQPARGFGQRIADFFFRLLPIESQL
jgi:putative cardiolipin synthase